MKSITPTELACNSEDTPRPTEPQYGASTWVLSDDEKMQAAVAALMRFADKMERYNDALRDAR